MKAPVTESFFGKETLAQVFSCEFCEISKNTFFYRTPQVAASFCIHCFPRDIAYRSLNEFIRQYFHSQG